MKDLEHKIIPEVGLGTLKLGTHQAEIRQMLGEPTETQIEDFGTGEKNEIWRYEAHDLVLTFEEDEDYRLGSITTENLNATFNGEFIVGLAEESLVEGKFGGVGPPMLEDDFEESGRDYGWDELNLSCWVADDTGLVVSVSILPKFDESGESIIWP